jgi:hypothetical protein
MKESTGWQPKQPVDSEQPFSAFRWKHPAQDINQELCEGTRANPTCRTACLTLPLWEGASEQTHGNR